MIETLASWFVDASASGPLLLLMIAVAAFLTTRISRLVIRRVIRRLATRTNLRPTVVDPSGFWQARSSRVGGESGEIREQRRRQRIDAAARMVNHLVSVVIWIVAAIVAFHLLDIDPAFFLSSAGFIGAGAGDRRPAQGQRLPDRAERALRGSLRRR